MKINEITWKRTRLGTALTVATILAGPLGGSAQERFEDVPPEFLLAYDADQNGVLSEEELQIAREHRKERRQQTQALWDTNKDGELQEEEIQHAHEIILNEILASRLDHFESVDLTADGKLDYNEFLQIPGMESRPEKDVEVTFQYIDKNGDSTITEDEFLEAFIPPEPDGPKEGTSADELSQMLRESFTKDFGRMDIDSSGDLSLEEFLSGTLPRMQVIGPITALLEDDFNYRDTDQSGTLSLEEYLALMLPSGPLDPFLSHDRNRDGSIERGEVAVVFLGAQDEMIDDWLNFHDGDLDGRITREEFEDRRARMEFEDFDLDGNEYLDREEFQAAMIGVEEAVDNLMKTFDADSDGKVTKSEFENPGSAEDEQFRMHDKNEDGFITRDEIMEIFGEDEQIVDEMISLQDEDGDGRIAREEWIGGF